MAIKMSFSRALIFSFIWHLFWFFAITIIIVPAGVRQSGFSDISFLGSIFDAGSLSEFGSGRRYAKTYAVSGLPRSPSAVAKRYTSYADKDYLIGEKPYKISINEILDKEKQLPRKKDEVSMPDPAKKYYQIEGEIALRAVVFMPLPPDCKGIVPVDAKSYYVVKLGIVVIADGTVSEAKTIESSGYPAVDMLATRYVKKWNFMPAQDAGGRQSQQGIITLKLSS